MQALARFVRAARSWRWMASQFSGGREAVAFMMRFRRELAGCTWEPHARYSVFTQYDQDYYLAQKAEFLHKYRCFWAVARTIAPKSIIELGVYAGSGADAYLSGASGATYLGIDIFFTPKRKDDGRVEDSYEVAQALFRDRGYRDCTLLRANLRTLDALPRKADLVVVDAAHDFDNAYADLKLALSAQPEYLFVDDAADRNQAAPAIDKFLRDDVAGRVRYTVPIDYIGGGLVIRLH